MTDETAAKPLDAEQKRLLERWCATIEDLDAAGYGRAQSDNAPERATATRAVLAALTAALRDADRQRFYADEIGKQLAAAQREVEQWKAEVQKQSAFAGECNRERLEEKRLRVETGFRVAALETRHEQLRQMILTQGETIHEQEERIEALETALAKARRALGEAAIPLEALRATEINGKALSPAVQAAIITATEAIRDALAALAGLPRGKGKSE